MVTAKVGMKVHRVLLLTQAGTENYSFNAAGDANSSGDGARSGMN